MASIGGNVEDFCRLCAIETKAGVIIYSTEGMLLCLEEKIVQCLRIEVSKEDMLPKKICLPCRSRLEESHCFAEQANKVQRTLELLVQMKDVKKHSSLAVEQNVDAMLDSEIDIKDEIDDLPLDVTLESDSEGQVESKPVVDSGGFGAPGVTSSITRHVKRNGNEEKKVEHSGRCVSRRKMLQPKKTNSGVLGKKRGRGQQKIPPSLNTAVDNISERIALNSKQEEKKEDEQEGKEDDKETMEECETVEQDISDHEQYSFEIYKADDLHKFKDLTRNADDGDDDEDEQEVSESAKEEWKTHWGIKCNQCDQIFPFRSQFDKHYQNSYNKDPIYTCSYCSKTMEKYSTFRSHCYRHVTEGRYRCEYCQKGFSLRSMLHVHILAKHTTVKPFICEECGKGFVTRPGLNIHLKKHKTGEKVEYPCSDCGKILHTRGGLTAHQNVHKLGRRFMCDVCGKTFTQKVNMLQHVKHHTGERPFACEKCGKCFAEKSHLNRHYSFHSEKRPFQCPVCLKMYKTERCLKVHAMVHAEARPYVCTYCNKGFLSTTKLKQHYNIHTGERPYACKFCERTFTNYPNWLKHTRRRHKEDAQTRNTSTRDLCQQNPISGEQQQQQQQQQHQKIIVQAHDLPNPLEEGRVSVHSQLSETSCQLTGTCMASNSAPASVDMLHQYPHHSQTVQGQSLSAQHAQEPHSVNLQSVHHQTMHQPSFSLSQVYSDHMMAMQMSHSHSILPL